MSKKLLEPHSVLIETVAGQLAATFYEIGRSQGLPSKHKDARAYARTNIEKFIAPAVDHLIDMLANPMISGNEKKMIFAALKERKDDPDMKALLPDIDISKVVPTKPVPPVIINTTMPKELKHG